MLGFFSTSNCIFTECSIVFRMVLMPTLIGCVWIWLGLLSLSWGSVLKSMGQMIVSGVLNS